MSRRFTEDKWMAGEHMKKFSTSTVIRGKRKLQLRDITIYLAEWLLKNLTIPSADTDVEQLALS